MRSPLPWLGLALLLAGCPPTHATPCATDAECPADQRCRRGACGPLCLEDAECGPSQVCLPTGTCGAPPECATSADCATGFTCGEGRCQCEDDSACAANQECRAGSCQARPRCTADADCLGTGGRCEVTQGLCLPACTLPADCAPTLDPRLAFALYACDQGTCTRRCTSDLQCGGAGLLCRYGLCDVADCAQASDCPQGQLCTSATFGRCEAFTVCTSSADCQRNFECRRYDDARCPPGFDCTQRTCQELPRCLADQDCVSGLPGTPTATVTGYCAEGHCQATSTCASASQCPAGMTCVAARCVPWVCRGHPDCPADQRCVDGACAAAPPPTDLVQLRLTPPAALLVVGDTLQLHLVGTSITGGTFPFASAVWQEVDAQGQPSTAAVVSPAGLLTADAPGEVLIRARVPGALVAPLEARITIYPRLTTGRRVVVMDAATGGPLSGVTVRACPADDCGAAPEVVTGADGVAAFPQLGAGPVTFSATPATLRGDGLPAWERASVLSTTVADLLLPLRENPVQAAAGFNASIAFTDVSTTGSTWAGFVAASASDVPSLTPRALLGEDFRVELAGLGQSVPVPGALVLYTSPGFGIPQEVKPRALAFAQPGLRFVQAWAGRAYLETASTLRATDLLSYLGAFDYAQDTGARFTSHPRVPDARDVDGDGLCSDAQRCPMGPEQVPDYARFTALTFQPRRQQQRRTEVVLPRVPSTFDTVLVAAVEAEPFAGVLPTGFASRAAGPPGQDGTRPVDPVILRSGPPYNGLEVATPGVWAVAANATGTAVSARLTRGPSLPLQVQVAPFLPGLDGASFSPAQRTLHPGQPSWASAFSSGAELARASLTGSQTRHAVYFAVVGGQTTLPWPLAPPGPGLDPGAESGARLELVAVDLAEPTTVDEVLGFGGVTLATWATAIDGYSRFDR